MIVAVFEGSDMSPQQYERVIAELDEVGLTHPAGRLQHVSGWMDGRFCVVDVWETPQQLATFGMTFFPLLERNGVSALPPHVYECYKTIGGRCTQDA